MNSSQSPINSTPFIIEHRQVEQGRRNFVPEAKLLLTPTLRTSGLLTALPDRAARPLLTLLSFLTSNGDIHPTIHELAQTLGISAGSVRDFMEPLTRLQWQGTPLAIPLLRESGMDGYMLSPKVTAHDHKLVLDAHLEATREPAPESLSYVPAGREAIVAASRAKYARPRVEVEREIEVALGHHPDEADHTPEGEARRRLYHLGVPREEIDSLLVECGHDEALQQLRWLPYRRAKSPARFIVAAIRGHYDPPPGIYESSPGIAEQQPEVPVPDDFQALGDAHGLGDLQEGSIPVPEVTEPFPETTELESDSSLETYSSLEL